MAVLVGQVSHIRWSIDNMKVRMLVIVTMWAVVSINSVYLYFNFGLSEIHLGIYSILLNFFGVFALLCSAMTSSRANVALFYISQICMMIPPFSKICMYVSTFGLSYLFDILTVDRISLYGFAYDISILLLNIILILSFVHFDSVHDG